MQAKTRGVAGEFAFHALHGFVSRSVGVAQGSSRSRAGKWI